MAPVRHTNDHVAAVLWYTGIDLHHHLGLAGWVLEIRLLTRHPVHTNRWDIFERHVSTCHSTMLACDAVCVSSTTFKLDELLAVQSHVNTRERAKRTARRGACRQHIRATKHCLGIVVVASRVCKADQRLTGER